MILHPVFRYTLRLSHGKALSVRYSTRMNLPSEYKKLSNTIKTSNFRQAVHVVTVPMPTPKTNEVLVKTRYAGVNASDVNLTAGRYFGGGQLPQDVGFESVGEIVAVGDAVQYFKVGSAVALLNAGAYSEYQCVTADKAFPLPRASPEYVALLVSGLTAAIGLDVQGRIRKGETVLITAAAGGLGHLAVQWAKASGCHVVGTCSSEEKEVYLKSIGCDSVINYKTHNLDEELNKVCLNGVDVVWETVGGKTFEILFKHLSRRGRLVVIGAITGYVGDTGIPDVDLTGLPMRLLMHSTSLSGFLLPHYVDLFPEYVGKLTKMLLDGKIVPKLDFGVNANGGELKGLEGCIRGVEYLHSGKSSGKVIVTME